MCRQTHTRSQTPGNTDRGSTCGTFITLSLSLPPSLRCSLAPARSTSRNEAHWPLIGVLMSALLIIHIHLSLSCALFYSHSRSIHQECLPPRTNTGCKHTRARAHPVGCKQERSCIQFIDLKQRRPWYSLNWWRSTPLSSPPPPRQ